jgi:hypothetical protein
MIFANNKKHHQDNPGRINHSRQAVTSVKEQENHIMFPTVWLQ